MRELTTEEKELVALNEARGYRYKPQHTSTTSTYRRLPGHVLVEEWIAPYFPADLSDLAMRTRIPLRRLQRLIRGQDRIDQSMATKLSKFFRNDPQYWLDLQKRFERGEKL
jgi:addiction module HigA family antidote